MKNKRTLEWILRQEDAQVAEWLLTHEVTRCPRRYAVESNHAAADHAGDRHLDGNETTAVAEPPVKRRRRPNRSAAQAVALTAAKKRQRQADETDLETVEIEE
jgi:hypothetical protein